MSVVAAAAGVLGKLVAKPLTDAAMRQERVLRALKAVRLDPRKPPQDFDGIYAVALIEYCAGRAESVLAVFRDEYVVGSFRRSFERRDLTRVRREVAEAVERNRETAGIWADPAGERLAVVTRWGELWLLDFRTGEILARTPLTDRLRGTRFSRGCGFDEDTLATIVRLGGIIVD